MLRGRDGGIPCTNIAGNYKFTGDTRRLRPPDRALRMSASRMGTATGPPPAYGAALAAILVTRQGPQVGSPARVTGD